MHLAGCSVAALIMDRAAWGFTPSGVLTGKPTIKVVPGARPGQVEVCDITTRQRYYLALADLSKALEGERRSRFWLSDPAPQTRAMNTN